MVTSKESIISGGEAISSMRSVGNDYSLASARTIDRS